MEENRDFNIPNDSCFHYDGLDICGNENNITKICAKQNCPLLN